MEIINFDHRELVDVLPDTLKVNTCSLLEGRRDAERHDNAGDSRMDTGVEHEVPEHKSYDDIE